MMSVSLSLVLFVDKTLKVEDVQTFDVYQDGECVSVMERFMRRGKDGLSKLSLDIFP